MLKDKAALLTLGIFLCGYVVLGLTGVSSTAHLLDNLIAGYLLAWGMYAILSDLPRKEIRIRFVLMTVAGTAILAIAELLGAAGLIDYQSLLGTPGRTWFDRAGFVHDSELGYRHEAHYQEQGSFVRGNIGEALCLPPNPPMQFDLRYDRHGFRNDEDIERADVVVLGDSYVESPMLPYSSLLTTALRQSLGTTVANLGLSGYGPEQELIVLKRYGMPLQPKVMVWIFFEGNDLAQLAPEEGASPNTFLSQNVSKNDYWMRSLTRNLLVLSKRFVLGCVPHPTYLQFRGLFREAGGKQTELFFWEKPDPLKPTDRLRLERLRIILAEGHELCRQQGIRFMVAFAPVSYRVHRGLPNFEPSTEEMRQWPLNDLPEQVASVVKEISPDIDFLDLTVPLKSAAAEGILTYLPDDTHWTAEGQRVAGEAIYQQVVTFLRGSRQERAEIEQRPFQQITRGHIARPAEPHIGLDAARRIRHDRVAFDSQFASQLRSRWLTSS